MFFHCRFSVCSRTGQNAVGNVGKLLSGVKVLSLDGGGVRGIVEIVTLQRLQHALGMNVQPCEMFNLVVGVSAGKFGRLRLLFHLTCSLRGYNSSRSGQTPIHYIRLPNEDRRVCQVRLLSEAACKINAPQARRESQSRLW